MHLFLQAEAKEAFKELLASVNTGSEWTWEQAMRLIVNDARCAYCMTQGAIVMARP